MRQFLFSFLCLVVPAAVYFAVMLVTMFVLDFLVGREQTLNAGSGSWQTYVIALAPAPFAVFAFFHTFRYTYPRLCKRSDKRNDT